MQDDVFDFCRNLLVVAYILALVPATFVSAIEHGAELEIVAYRLRHYEFNGVVHGSRSTRVAWDAVVLGSDLLRKALIVEWAELRPETLEEQVKASLGAVIVVLPSGAKDLKSAYALENAFSELHTDQAVYFVEDSVALRDLKSKIAVTSQRTPSAAAQLANFIVGSQYVLMSRSSAQPAAITAKQFNVLARLRSSDPKVPTIALVAHYDAASIAPGYTKAADANGSGVAALLELIAVFRSFYSDGVLKPRFNLLFAFTAAGMYNFQGGKQLTEAFKTDDVKLVTCLEALGGGDELYMQVSKVPKEQTLSAVLFDRIKLQRGGNTTHILHKKIDAKSDYLAWEHEVFNIQKKHAVTFSGQSNPEFIHRNSIFDSEERVNIDQLYANTRAIANGLLSILLPVNESVCADAFAAGVECSIAGSRGVNKGRLSAFLDATLSLPRHAEQSPVYSNFLSSIVEKYGIQPVLQEIRISDAVIYNTAEDVISAYVTKPAVFEFFVAGCIGVYLFAFYHAALQVDGYIERKNKRKVA